jgi:hypothetical protein
MTDDFDPYYEWLGIGRNQRPVNHYALLGISLGEHDHNRISNAADQRVAYLRSLQSGKRGVLTQQLLNEVATAVGCLLDPVAKKAYDEQLAASTNPQASPSALPTAPPPAIPQVAGPTQSPMVDPMAPVRSAVDGVSAAPPPPPTANLPQSTGVEAPPALSHATAFRGVAAPSVAVGSRSAKDDPDGAESPGAAGFSPLLIGAAALAAVFFAASLVLGVGAWMGWLSPAEDVAELDPPEVIIGTPDSETSNSQTDVAVVTQEGDGGLRFAPSFAKISPDLRLVNVEGQMVTAGWESTEQSVQWRVRLIRPGVFQARISYSSRSEAPAGILEVTANEKSQLVSLRGSGGSDKFVAESFFLALPRSGSSSVVLRAKEIGPDGFIELRSLECSPRRSATSRPIR